MNNRKFPRLWDWDRDPMRVAKKALRWSNREIAERYNSIYNTKATADDICNILSTNPEVMANLRVDISRIIGLCLILHINPKRVIRLPQP